MINGLNNTIKVVFDNILRGAGKKYRNVVAINQYNSIDISEETVYDRINSIDYPKIKNKEVSVYYHQFDSDDMCGAYEPFLDYIYMCVKNFKIDIDELLNECKVLPIQRDMFINYFNNGLFIRNEMLIYNEAEYEAEAFITSLMLMLKFVAKKQPVIMLLNKIHCSCDTTIKLLNTLINDGCKEISFVVSYDNACDIDKYMQQEWIELNNTLKQYDSIIEWQSELTNHNPNQTLDESVEKLNQYYCKLFNMKGAFAFKQAYYYAEKLHNIITRNKENIDLKLRYDFYGILTIICIFSDKIASAILFLNEIRLLTSDESCNEEMKMQIEFYYDYLLGYTQMYNNHENDANESAKKCIETAKKMGNERAIFCGELVEHMSRFSGWKNDTWFGEYNEEIDEKLIEKAEKYGFVNHLAHILVYGFDNDVEKYSKVEGLEKRIYHWKKGIKLASDIKNDKFVLDACKKAIMLASISGFYKVSDYIYIEYANPVALRTGNTFEEANIYNGIGFNQCMEGDYPKANEYFNKALELFMKEKEYDYVAETLYNMAINCIKACEYDNGDVFVTTVIKILDNLKKSMMRVCHLSKLYGLKAVCAIMTGNIYTAANYADRARQYLSAVIDIKIDDPYMKYWRDDLFLYNYARLCIELEMGNVDKADRFLKRALEFTIGGGTFDELMYECTDIESFKERYKEEKTHIIIRNTRALDLYTVDEIIKTTKNISVQIEYDSMKKDLEFIGTWKQLLNNMGKNTYLLVENAANSFENNYNVTNFIVIQYTRNEPALLFNDSKNYMDRVKLNKITEYFEKNPRVLFVTKFERGFSYYKDILDLFEGEALASFLAVPFFKKGMLDVIVITYSKIKNTWNRQESRIKTYENALKFYYIIFQGLVEAIERINDKTELENKAALEDVNKELEALASIDRLTGIHNRQGLYKKIDWYISNNIKDICVAYIDLDNFKYYNDHFGHDVGDVVLKEVANVLSSICGQNDIAVRYGGDEFLILLNTNDIKKAAEKLEIIYDVFRDNNYYIDIISNLLDKPVEIPDNYKISCSVGVAKVYGNSLKEDISTAITNADKTLYYIKRTTKRCCKIYDEVRELIQ